MTDPAVQTSDSELRALVERALGAHYELDCEIGRGGMGIVYRAKDRRLKRTVAIKVLPPELAFRGEIKTRFLREAETAAQLNHPNIVDIYSVDESQGLVFFVMAYIPGDNLAKRLHDRGAMAVEDVRRILRDVADALAYAHERGVVHRDIKPDNILIDEGSGRPMVTDFGIARAVSDGDNRLTATGIAIGTPTYMSPEQAAGDREIDGRSDLYALGVVAYQMLVGRPPFEASSTPAMLVKHLSERPPAVEQRRADVPRDLARVVMTLLEKDPAARFSSAQMMVKVLDGTAMSARDSLASMSAPAEARSSYGFAQPPGGAVAPLSPMPPMASYSPSPLPLANEFGDRGSFTGAYRMPVSPEEMRRWDAIPVKEFRRKLAPYLYVNAVIVLLSVFGERSFFGLTVMWTIYMAWKYAKLWSNGYDWRDVFRQPRHVELVDVVEDSIGYMKAMFNKDERARMRNERISRAMQARTSGQMAMPSGYGGAAPEPVMPPPLGRPDDANMAVVRQAQRDRDDIMSLMSRLTPDQRAQVPDVGRSAALLADKVQALAYSLADLDRSAGSQTATQLEAEIVRLENDANPLDVEASETRVKRLAFLKRQRRGVADVVGRRKQIAGKLETCASALASMKLDLSRLSVGSANFQNITSLANEAMSLAKSVDHVLSAADEVGRLTSDRVEPRPI